MTSALEMAERGTEVILVEKILSSAAGALPTAAKQLMNATVVPHVWFFSRKNR